ncbi:serine hydrolase [Staphylospora marina]|uniref:serine hydrolase n=1 Tax=Staphylospora marina TaxID=2490858 RepID=UPI001F14FD0F|nr:serine hydrolase [Staphylospora marina]
MARIESLFRKLDEWKSTLPGTWGLVVEDLQTGTRWTVNEDRLFYAASLIKVPIMAAVYREEAAGRLTLEEEWPLSLEDQVGGSGILQHLSPGIRLPIRDLVTLMIIQSDNTATNMLIRRVGTETIRKTMVELGMRHSRFHNPLMIVPYPLENVNVVTAADMAACFRRIARGEAVSLHASRRMIRTLKKQQDAAGLPSLLPPKHPEGIVGLQPLWEWAHKTGQVNRILHDAGILYVGGRALSVTALSEGLDIRTARSCLGELGLRAYEWMREPG